MKKLKKERHILPSPTDIRVKDDFEEKKKEFIMKKSHGTLEGGVTNLERLVEIEELFETQDDESLDVDRVTALLEELEADAPAPEMKLPIDSRPDQRPKPRAVPRFVRPVASVAAALFICFAMSTTALGKSIINVIFDRDSEQVYIEGPQQEKTPNENALALRAAIDEISEEYIPLPTWIPEEYHLENTDYFQSEGYDSCDATFVSKNGEFHIYIDIHGPDTVWGGAFEKDKGGKQRTIAGIECYLFTNMDNPIAYWNYGNVEVTITNDIPMEELELITDSIK